MSVYAIFIFRFYRFLAAKDIFKLDVSKHNNSSFKLVRKTIGLGLYIVKYLIMFPVFAFFWFLVLAVLLSFGPLGGFWVVTARPDIWALALEVTGALLFLRHSRLD